MLLLANPHRGECALGINGRQYHLRLTLGALAALEAHLGCKSLGALFERVSSNTFKSEDIIFVLEAGVYGAGQSHIDIANASISGGAKAAANCALNLLEAAFNGEIADHETGHPSL